MFKKITSNRDPRDTLWSELQKEFGGHYTRFAVTGREMVNRNPRIVFITMILLMLVSTGLSFTIFRNREPAVISKKTVRPVNNPLSTGFGQLLQTGEALRQTIALKQQADSLIAKKQLTSADSAALEKALDKLQQLNKHFKP